MAEYTRPYLYPKQQKAIFSNRRWALCEASTKSGKTVASIARIIEWGLIGNGKVAAAPGQTYWWVAPVSDQARIAFSRVKQNLTGGFTSRESPVPSIQLITGPTIVFKSADNSDSLYGEDVYGAIIDEASRCRPEAWHAVRSTLTATRGPCVMIGNVKGRRNWFYEFCRRAEAGQDPNASFMRITWRDAVEANVLDLEEIEDARRNLPEAVFKELYEAVANDDSGNPFGEDHIYACVFDPKDEDLKVGPTVAFGIDLAKHQDYLVVIGLDENGNVSAFHRWNGVPWRDSIRRIHEIVGEDVPALVDSTGVGDPVLEELQEGHGNFRGLHFSPASKQRLMEGLAVSIQSHEIGFPDGQIKSELLSYEYVTYPSGVRYAAASGWNDDCVCALALARQQWTENNPAKNLMEYYATQAANSKREIDRAPGLLTDPDEPRHRAANLATAGEDFAARVENELTELYNQTVAKYQPQTLKCFRCHQYVGADRVSDGVMVWHRECISGGNMTA